MKKNENMYAILQINKGAFFKQKDKLFRGDKKVISEFYIMKSYSFCRLFPSRFFVFLYFSAKSGKKTAFFRKKRKNRADAAKFSKKQGIFVENRAKVVNILRIFAKVLYFIIKI